MAEPDTEPTPRPAAASPFHTDDTVDDMKAGEKRGDEDDSADEHDPPHE